MTDDAPADEPMSAGAPAPAPVPGGAHRRAPSARRAAAAVVLLGAVGLVLLGVAPRVVGRARAARPPTGQAVGAASSVIRPVRVVTPSPLPTLPIPDALPDDPDTPTPAVVVGTIEIPKIGLRADLQAGMALDAIDRGPSWWPGTARPGQLGNVVIAGHRTTFTHPFARLDELSPGDRVDLTTTTGRFVYEVRGVIVVPQDWIDIAAQSDAHTATLFACHPPGSATERIVVKLRLLDDEGQPVDPYSMLPPLDAEAHHLEHTLLVRTADAAPSPGAGALTGADG